MAKQLLKLDCCTAATAELLYSFHSWMAAQLLKLDGCTAAIAGCLNHHQRRMA